MGFDLIELAFSGGTLRLTIDKPGGITLDDCVVVNRRLSLLLDAQDPIQGHYRLEVSSPGLNRRLRTREDFARFTGRKVKVITQENIYKGIIKGLAGDGIILVTDDDSEMVVHINDIKKANLDFDF